MANGARGYPTAYRSQSAAYGGQGGFQKPAPPQSPDAALLDRVLEVNTPARQRAEQQLLEQITRRFDAMNEPSIGPGKSGVPDFVRGYSGVPDIPQGVQDAFRRALLAGGARLAGRFIPGMNWALTAHDVYTMAADYYGFSLWDVWAAGVARFETNVPGSTWDISGLEGAYSYCSPPADGPWVFTDSGGCGGSGFAAELGYGGEATSFIATAGFGPGGEVAPFWVTKWFQTKPLGGGVYAGRQVWDLIQPVPSATDPRPPVYPFVKDGTAVQTLPNFNPDISFDAIPGKARSPLSESGEPSLQPRPRPRPRVLEQVAVVGGGARPPIIRDEYRAPPPPGAEQKGTVRVTGVIPWLFGVLTEACDAVDAFYDALPDSRKKVVWLHKSRNQLFRKEVKMKCLNKGMWVVRQMQAMAEDALRTGSDTELNQYLTDAIANLILNHVEDAVIGRLSRAASREFGRVTGRPVGVSWGTAL